MSFKPYYKWITFNTNKENDFKVEVGDTLGFKPYYKWITFNTMDEENCIHLDDNELVLNLIINGLPSIHIGGIKMEMKNLGFKPYYKWITFNTLHNT